MTVLIISRLEFELLYSDRNLTGQLISYRGFINTCLIFGDKVSNQKYPLFANNVVL